MQESETVDADRNWRCFVLFRVLFNSRFYYPVLAVLFLDLGLSATQYTLLNFAWAISIVCLDLPAGALADRIGRRPLVVAAAVAMVTEMTVLCLAPIGGGTALFLFCLANRILSGAAEGMASGADEALVFDSLAERGRSAEWPLVLDQVTRWQSVGMVAAMLVGGAVYDPGFMNRFGGMLGWSWRLDQSVTLRFPIYLNLVAAVLTLLVALRLREPAIHEASASKMGESGSHSGESVLRAMREGGRWIARTPLALFVIIAGVLLDSVVRLFLTFSSSYFRLIELPAASYGIIGASLGALGFIVAPIARRMARHGSAAGNFVAVAAVTLFGLIGLAARWRWWGALFMIPIGAAMTAIGFLVSYYLNALVESGRRATVLSFKGLVFNLGYGFVSLLFALALRHARHGSGSAEETFGRTLVWLPLWLILTLAVLVLFFRRHAPELRRVLPSGSEAQPTESLRESSP
jgi:MFS family permease